MLLLDTAINHTAHTPIADREALLLPILSRAIHPDDVVFSEQGKDAKQASG
jgi:hypothetical protein